MFLNFQSSFLNSGQDSKIGKRALLITEGIPPIAACPLAFGLNSTAWMLDWIFDLRLAPKGWFTCVP